MERKIDPVTITVYRWGGSWGPFKIKVPCGECALTGDIIQNTLEHELKGIPVEVITHDWLSKWWQPLRKGAWHAPIVLVNGKVISAGVALNRGVLTQAVMEAHAIDRPIRGSVVFGKTGCGVCEVACTQLDTLGIPYNYYDVIEDPSALYEMLARVKPQIHSRTPITVPQIWLNGRYLGGMEELDNLVLDALEPFLGSDANGAPQASCPTNPGNPVAGC